MAKELTKEQAEKLKKATDAKTEVVSIVAQPLKLNVGEFAFLKYVGKEEVKKSESVENDFTAFIFYDAIFDTYFSVAGTALDKIAWELNRYYKMTFNGERETGKKQRFNAWIVEILPKDFSL